MSGHLSHVTGLHRAAESSPQFVSAGLDDRVMRDTHDRAIDAIQGDRDTGGLPEQLIQFFLKRCRRFIHESASAEGGTASPKCQVAALYHRIGGILY